MENVIQCLAAFLGCFGFCFIFRIHRHLRFALIGSLLGTVGWIVYLATQFLDNVFFQTFIAMLCVSLISEICARLFKAPATIFIIVGCFPLVPGSGIYYTMLYAVQGHSRLFADSLISTLGISIAIALAILVSLTTFQVYKRIKTKDFAPIE